MQDVVRGYPRGKGITPYDRFLWATRMPPDELERLQQASLVQSSDHIHGVTIPGSTAHRLPFLTQLQLIARAHARRKEDMVFPQESCKIYAANYSVMGPAYGGGFRGEEARINVSIGNDTRKLFDCPRWQDVPELLNNLTTTVEKLFPYGGENPAITEETIYTYLAGIQLAFVLIHPLLEANGRVSEDILYTLWARRPDLQDTLRFLSHTGERNADATILQNHHLQLAFLAVVRGAAVHFGITKELASYDELEKEFLATYTGVSRVEFSTMYYQYIFDYINLLIQYLNEGDTEAVDEYPQVRELARNLQSGSTEYKFKK